VPKPPQITKIKDILRRLRRSRPASSKRLLGFRFCRDRLGNIHSGASSLRIVRIEQQRLIESVLRIRILAQASKNKTKIQPSLVNWTLAALRSSAMAFGGAVELAQSCKHSAKVDMAFGVRGRRSNCLCEAFFRVGMSAFGVK
jgi:hypothetical protein